MEETKTNDSVKTLKCTKCKKTKNADEHFLARYSSKNKYTKQCQKCRDIAKKSKKNPNTKYAKREAEYHEKKDKRMERGCDWPGCTCTSEFMKEHGHFDHEDENAQTYVDLIKDIVITKNPKYGFTISDWYKLPDKTLQDLDDEMDKTINLCPSHHRIRTAIQRRLIAECNDRNRTIPLTKKQLYDRKRDKKGSIQIDDWKLSKKECACGCGRKITEENKSGFSANHRDANTKHKAVSNMRKCSSKTIATELDKCNCYWENCHVIFTKKQRAEQRANPNFEIKIRPKLKTGRPRTGSVSYDKARNKWMVRRPYGIEGVKPYFGYVNTEEEGLKKLEQDKIDNPSYYSF
jgi:hypothetical protein